MKLIICILFTGFNLCSYSQSLSPQRIERITLSTVRITIDSMPVSGTGFFVKDDGCIVTCFHVIVPSIIINGNNVTFRKIYATTSDGQTFEYGLSAQMLNDTSLIKAFRGFDFAILKPIIPYKNRMPFLRLAEFSAIAIGTEVYTSGYPLNLKTQFISKGTLAGKKTEVSQITTNTGTYTMQMNQGLLDLTMNPGNSGGAIIAIGKTIEDDRVVGLADFIINPISPFVNGLTNLFQNASKNGSVSLMGIDPIEMYALFTNIMANTSVGISGCVSTNHIIEWLNRVK